MIVKCQFCSKNFHPQYSNQKFCSVICANRFNLNNKKQVKLPIHYSERLAEFLGILFGDGSVTKYYLKVYLNPVADFGYATYIKKICRKLFPGAFISHYFRIKKGTEEIQISSKDTTDYIRKCGFNSKKRIIPSWISRDTNFIKATIRGLFDTEGSIGIKYFKGKNGNYFYKQLTFTNRNKNLLTFIEKQLKLLGYNPTHKSKKNIYLSSADGIHRYFKEIGSHNPKLIKKFKQKNLVKERHRYVYKKTVPNNNNETRPYLN
jgi:hypothetical protein